jgi:uncharacterized NAD-dependent epimerase/dehydratase family protein
MDAPSAYAILADHSLGIHSSKTAVCLLRHHPGEVSVIIDREHAGKSVEQVLDFGGSVPVVATLAEALEHAPDRLLIGVSPPGGQVPPEWRAILLEAIEAGLDLYSGMHGFLSEDQELVAAAEAANTSLVDLRRIPDDLGMPSGARAGIEAPVVLTVGSDCNVGKMTAAWEIVERAQARGRAYRFAATGQTGVLLSGRGMAIDRVIADFLAGAAERLVVEAAEGAELILLEGQGSLVHPFYSGVTLGLLHGGEPDAMILCHVAGRRRMRHCERIEVPPLPDLVRIYEETAGWIRPAPVIGVALATHPLDEEAAHAAIVAAREETGLPVEDPVRFPTGELFEACEKLTGERG